MNKPIPKLSPSVSAFTHRDGIDLAAHRALREIRAMAEHARRSLGQRIRWARTRVAAVTR